MKRYFAYIRVSTKRQGVEGASLPEQRRAIEKYACERDLTIIEWFEEQETAAKRGRPIFGRMLAKLSAGVADGIVIHKIDRSARNLKDWANLGDLIDAGADVRFAHESIDLTTRGGRLAADIQAVVAADYIRNLREEIKKGIQGRLRDGLYPLPAPLGYLNAGGGKPKVIDPVRGPLVREAFELYATGTTSLKQLRREMRLRGLETRSGKPISVQSFWNILHNPFYTGLMRLKSNGELFEGKHEPLVSKATFDRVQEIASGKAALRSAKHDFAFRNLVTCLACGRHLVGERQKSRYVYYRCHNEACKGINVREEELDHEVQTALANIGCDTYECNLLAEITAEERGRDTEATQRTRASIKLHLANVDGLLNRATDAFLEGTLDKEAFEARKRRALEEKREMRDRLAELDAPDFSPAESAFEVLELGNTALHGYRNGNYYEKRAIIHSVCSNFTVSGKSPAFSLKNPFQQIAEWRKSQNSGAPRAKARTRARQLYNIVRAHAEAERKAVLKARREELKRPTA